MKKLFKKFAIAMIGLLTSIGIANMSSSNNKATVAEAATITGGETFYLKPSSNWKADNARFAIYFFGSGNAWVSMTAVEGETDVIYQADAPSGSWTNLIFCRMNPSSTSNSWDTKWNQTSDLTFDGTKNMYTVAAGTWDKGGGTWSTYTPPSTPSTFYTISFYDGTDLKKTVTDIAEGTEYNDLPFYEKEGYRLDGWYTDSSLTNKFVKGTAITGDTNLYAKYVAAEDYTIYFKDSENKFGDTVYVYMWSSSVVSENASWPGEIITKNEDGKFVIDIDASKSFDGIIFNNGSGDGKVKTEDLTLEGTKDGDTFVLGSKNSSGHYTATLEEYVTISIYDGETLIDTIKHTKGTEYKAPLKTKSGYRLLGYYTDASLDTPYVSGTTISENITLYAKYEEATTTTFYVDITDMKWEEKGTLDLHLYANNIDNDVYVTDYLTKISTDFYSVTLNSEDSYDRIQFHNSNGSYTKPMDIDYTANGTYIILGPDKTNEHWHHDVDYVAPVVKAHIANEEVDVTVKHITTGDEDTVDKATATSTGISLIRYEEGKYTFSSEVSEEAKATALKEYFTKLDTCANYANADEYAALVALVTNGRDIVITETVGDNAELTIGAKLDYLSYMKANNSTVSSTSNNLLDLGNKKNTIGFIGLVSILGLISIAGYYFLNKKKEA